MGYVRIPLSTTPNATQSFRVTIAGGKKNVNVVFKTRYFDLYNYWLADVFDASTGEALVCGMPLVPGTNLLGQFEHFGVGEAYIVPVTTTNLEQPDNQTLGSTFVLVWGDDS